MSLGSGAHRSTRRAALAGGGALTLVPAAACAPGGGGGPAATPADLSRVRQPVLVWGPTGAAELPARQAQLAVFGAEHPNLPAEVVPAPFTSAQGVEGMQKLFAAVAAGDPPEAAWIDRFQLANLAVRRTVASVDAQLKRDRYDLKRHFAPLLEEVTGIDGKIYGLPSSTDNRALWWNKRQLRESRVDAEKGPATWDDLRQFATRATRSGGDDALTQLGWNFKSPGFGILYLWSWLAGAEFFARGGRTAQYDHPGVVEALNFLLAGADAQGGSARVDAFLAPGAQAGDPFVADRIAMQLASPLAAVARQRPDMDFGWGPVPVRRPGDRVQTFAGGFAWAVPAGTKNPEVSWAVLRSLLSEAALSAWAEAGAGPARAGGGVYLPGFTTVEATDRAFRQRFATGIKTVDAAWDFTIDLMRFARVRPVSPAAAEAWDGLSETWNTVLARKQTPKAACDALNARVQRALDEAYSAARA